MSFIWAVMIKLYIIIAAGALRDQHPRVAPLRRLNQRQQRGQQPGVRNHQWLATAARATKPSGFTADVLRQFPQASPYAGRLHRLHASKHDVVIYDYVDENEPLLAKMASKCYQRRGFAAEPPG
jgi:hypothetical protein